MEQLKSEIIQSAASLARGDFLGDLYQLAEDQKSISCGKLNDRLDDVHDKLKEVAILLRNSYDYIQSLEKDHES